MSQTSTVRLNTHSLGEHTWMVQSAFIMRPILLSNSTTTTFLPPRTTQSLASSRTILYDSLWVLTYGGRRT